MLFFALAVLAASPTTFNNVIAAAKPGDTVNLVAGTYGKLVIKAKTYDPPLTVDASAATVTGGVQLLSSSGITWTGGTIGGDPTLAITAGDGFFAQLGSNITVSNVHISDQRNGVVYDRVTGGKIDSVWISRMSADGIDLAMSRNIVVSNNSCSEFHQAPTSHPDCIQLWSKPTNPPVADVTITGNTVLGVMQGISLFNHVANGVDDGGFDRITINNNNVQNVYADAISVYDCRSCTVRYNYVNSLPNYDHFAQLYVTGGSVDVCGNTVVRVPRQAGPACPK